MNKGMKEIKSGVRLLIGGGRMTHTTKKMCQVGI
jgi:hypothetical protein